MSQIPRQTPRVLIVDDEADIRDPLADYLSRNDWHTVTAPDAATARAKVLTESFDLVILDIMMPGEDGLSLCRHLRATTNLPVILLTARSDEIDRVVGLEIGADDYVVKPFAPRELLARMRAVLRRANPREASSETRPQRAYHFDRWILRVDQRELTAEDGAAVPLSAAEFRLLLAFVQRPKMVLSRDQLLDLADARDAEAFDRSIDNRIVRLRRKLELDPKDPKLIKTVWGGGYSLACDVQART